MGINIEALSAVAKKTELSNSANLDEVLENGIYTFAEGGYWKCLIVFNSGRIVTQIKFFQEFNNNVSRVSIRIYDNGIWNEWMPLNNLGYKSKGTTEERPTSLKASDVGFMYFDTTLGKPIYAKSITINSITWVDATGAGV